MAMECNWWGSPASEMEKRFPRPNSHDEIVPVRQGSAISEDEKHVLSTAGGFPFEIDQICPVHQGTDLERMYRVSLETAKQDNNNLRLTSGILLKRLDAQDQQVIGLQNKLAAAEFERDRLYNHQLMRFVRWLKGWDWMAGRE